MKSNVKLALESAYNSFRNDPLEQLRVRFRRIRAEQLRDLLNGSREIDYKTFNREVWQIESSVLVNGQDYKGRIFGLSPLNDDEIAEVNTALGTGTFEIHGNSIWRPASGVFGPREPDLAKKEEALREAVAILNESNLAPGEKDNQLRILPGFGPNTATGLVMVLHPNEYALQNQESLKTFQDLGYDTSPDSAFQQSARNLKKLLGAEDFIELDWFLYQYVRQETQNKDFEAEPEVVVETAADSDPLEEQASYFLKDQATHSDAPASRKYWWVCQGGTYPQESKGGYVWAPQLTKSGRPVEHHVNVSLLALGEIVFHYANGAIRAVGVVVGSGDKAKRPKELSTDEWQSDGYMAMIDYYELTQPIGLNEIPLEWRASDVGPFDKNGGVKQTYMNSVTSGFADALLRQFADRMPSKFRGAKKLIVSSRQEPIGSIPPIADVSAEPSSSITASELPARIVKISPGPNGSFWEECLKGEFICVGWDKVGDLQKYADKAALLNALRALEIYKTGAKASAKTNELWTLRELQPGDVVIANRGNSEILGVGHVVAPGYAFRDDRGEYKHTVSVEWIAPAVNKIPPQGHWALVTVAPVSLELYLYVIGKGPLPNVPLLVREADSDERDPASIYAADGSGERSDGGDAHEKAEEVFVDVPDYAEPSFDEIRSIIAEKKLRISDRDLRRYHLSLKTRGFVILSGLSGTGKTWLAQLYAEAVRAKPLLVAVAPNWTTNEDLLGYHNPFTNTYHDTPFSLFLRQADKAYRSAIAMGRTPQPFHLILDEMNLARVEYYFARFLSAMEVRARSRDDGSQVGSQAMIEFAPNDHVSLPPNFFFVGTVNMDETTHSFADKVYDRAQLIEIRADRAALKEHLADALHADLLLQIWDAVNHVAPFAFRVLDEITAYLEESKRLDSSIPWENALDEQLIQKVLPKLKGAEPRVGEALSAFLEITEGVYPLSHAKATLILSGFRAHGIASYF